MNKELPYTVEAAEEAARELDIDAIRAEGDAQAARSQFIPRDGRSEDEQLADLYGHECNKLANHMATHGCMRCAKAFTHGFTSVGPQANHFCPKGMQILMRIALLTKTMSGKTEEQVD
jgi:hypothetical protein